MQPSSIQWVEIGVLAAGAPSLLLRLARRVSRKPEQTAEGWRFPVKLNCLLVYWAGLVAGVSEVAIAGRYLLTAGAAHWIGWAGFACGVALVLRVLLKWPEPLILDREGLLRRGSSSSRIRWQELSHVRHYKIRLGGSRWDRGVVIHSVYGKQLVVAERTYGATVVLESLLDRQFIPIHSLEDSFAPIPISKVPLPISK